MKYRILLVDDEPVVRSSLRRLLDHRDWTIDEAEDLDSARDWLRRQSFDLAIVDYRLGAGNGMEVLEHIRDRHPRTLVLMLTAYGNVSLAVEAIKKGAFDFLEKEGEPQLTRHVVEKALEQCRLRKEVELLQQRSMASAKLPQIISRSQRMTDLLEMVDDFARTDATVLIQGETGTGKSLLAEFIHYASPRADGPFVTINCGAIPKELIESELFGYTEGAFTGAHQKGKMGLIERAHGGSLLLDEIGDLSLDLQSKLLHVLENREFLRVGAVEPTRVDVRFIAATNVDLADRIAAGRFRKDLYYRLNVAAVTVPPLRDRPDDILPLAQHFVHRLGSRYDKTVHTIDGAAESWLLRHSWPGNVRELRNILERAILLLKGGTLQESNLMCAHSPAPANGQGDGSRLTLRLGSGDDILADLTRQVVRQAWEQSGCNQSQAARLLGIPRTTFQTYVQKYDLGS